MLTGERLQCHADVTMSGASPTSVFLGESFSKLPWTSVLLCYFLTHVCSISQRQDFLSVKSFK